MEGSGDEGQGEMPGVAQEGQDTREAGELAGHPEADEEGHGREGEGEHAVLGPRLGWINDLLVVLVGLVLGSVGLVVTTGDLIIGVVEVDPRDEGRGGGVAAEGVEGGHAVLGTNLGPINAAWAR